MSHSHTNDNPPLCDDTSESGSSEEAQHNARNHMLELFTLQGSSPRIQQCLQRRVVQGGVGVPFPGGEQGNRGADAFF